MLSPRSAQVDSVGLVLEWVNRGGAVLTMNHFTESRKHHVGGSVGIEGPWRDRVLFESEQRPAVNIGHVYEINGPLTVVMANLRLLLEALHRSLEGAAGIPEARIPRVAELERIKGRMTAIAGLLEECQARAARISETVGKCDGARPR